MCFSLGADLLSSRLAGGGSTVLAADVGFDFVVLKNEACRGDGQAGERVQQCGKRALFFESEVAWADLGIEGWVRPAAFGIEVEHIFKRLATTFAGTDPWTTWP